MANYNSSHTGAEIDSAIGRVKDTAVTAGTIAASLGVVVDANKDISGFRNVTLTGQLQAATINLTGDTTIGDGDSDNITINADVNSNIIPNTDNTFDLGSASKQWKDLYVNGIGYIDQLGTDADPIAIYASSGEIDGTAIGSESASTGAFTTGTFSGVVDVTDTTDASDATGDTGALRTEGGASIAKKLYVGTDLDVDGVTNLDVVDIDGAVDMSSTLAVGSDLTVTGQDIQTGASNWLHLGDDSRIVSIGQGNELNFLYDTNSDAAIYVNYNGYGGSNTQFRDFAIANGKGSVIMTVDGSASAVGIGVTSPAYPLDIVSTINNGAALAIRGDVDADGRFSGIQFGDNGSTSYSKGGIFYEGKDGFARGNLHFALEGGTGADNADLSDARMTITYDGNVGIGTTSPSNPLQIAYSNASGTDYLDGDAGLYLANSGSDGTMIKFGDTNAGLVYGGSGTGTFKVMQRQNTAVFIDASRNVGINETNPAGKMHIALDDGTMPSVVASESALVLQNNSATGDGCTMTIISGTANNSQICFGDAGDYDAGVILYNNSADAMTFRTGGSGEDMRIDSTGAVLFNTTTRTSTGNGGATFDPNSVGRAVLNLGSVNYTQEVDLVRLFNNNGEVGDIRTNGSGASFNSNSDYRLKENQVTLPNALTRLNNLKPYRFNFKADPSTTLDGFFAHEVQEVVPEAVTGTKDQMMPIQYQPSDDIPEGKEVYDIKEYSTTEINAQKMDASKLVPLLVKAVQELSAKVEALENA